MDAIDRHQVGPWWQPSGIDIGRRRALVGLSGIVMATMSARPVWAQARLAAGAALAQGQPRSCVLTPEAGEGPFYLDPKLIRSDITSKQPGAPLNLSLQVVRAGDCATLANARVDVWHADALGLYSGYERQSGVGGIATKAAVGQQYLRGTQITDAAGNVGFRTIFPSWYGGRTPHVHFKVFLGGNEVVASQIFFPDEVSKEIFSSWDPYRQHATKRTTFNTNDPIKQGIFSEVARQRGSYAAKAVLVVASR
jgi:protocatechuate 3,4-dioxygenase beta subunit